VTQTSPKAVSSYSASVGFTLRGQFALCASGSHSLYVIK
jgi:hypothetical protein